MAHIEGVGEYATILSLKYGAGLGIVEVAAILHDIGYDGRVFVKIWN